MTERQQHIENLKFIGNLARQFGCNETLQCIIDAYKEYDEKENGLKLPWN